MTQFCYHLPPMKSWLTLTDLGSRSFFRKVSQAKKLLKKIVFKKYVPKLSCYDDFSFNLLDFSLRRECHAKSVSSESCLKSRTREFCPHNFFNLAFLYQNEGFDNLKTRKFEGNKIQGKSVVGEKDEKCD